jgi:hypothetical protein
LGGEDKRLTALRRDYPSLRDLVAELGRIAAWAADRNARIRVTYELEQDA